MQRLSKSLTRFLVWSCKTAGKPISFMIAWLLLCLWAVIGFIWGFTDTWILVLNTVATVNALLMVFMILNTQNRESKALHLTIDGLIKAIEEASNDLIAIEQIEEEELELIRKKLFKGSGL